MLADAVRQVEVVGWDVVNEGVVGLLSVGKHNGACIGVWGDGVNHVMKLLPFCHTIECTICGVCVMVAQVFFLDFLGVNGFDDPIF